MDNKLYDEQGFELFGNKEVDFLLKDLKINVKGYIKLIYLIK